MSTLAEEKNEKGLAVEMDLDMEKKCVVSSCIPHDRVMGKQVDNLQPVP